jgi:hypothetical protein
MLSQTGINTDPKYEWMVPYDDVFRFVIETTGTESIVAITIEASAPQPSDNYLIFVVVAVVVVVGILVALLIIRSRKGSRPPRLPPPPPPSSSETST